MNAVVAQALRLERDLGEGVVRLAVGEHDQDPVPGLHTPRTEQLAALGEGRRQPRPSGGYHFRIERVEVQGNRRAVD